RDLEQHIKHDSRLQIDGQRSETVTGNSISVLQAEEQRTVSADHKVQILGSDHLHVATSAHTRAGQSVLVEAGQEIHLKAGALVGLEAGAALTLNAGGQHIVISAAGIYCSSPIQLGGVPIPGTPAMPAIPNPVEPLIALAPGPQIEALMAAARGAKPICPVCEKMRGTPA
ncbi:type VI secretion system tip protein VgrG, partial [Pseudomonas lundensis]|nr:type VI secretion system tip protein VgrG [Pseudomonas lundensis]